MPYTYTINCKIPTESSTPIVVYDSDYKSLDFYHVGAVSDLSPAQVPKFNDPLKPLDTFLQNVSIDSDGTFTKQYMDHRDDTQLGFNVESDYSQTASYDPVRPKSTRFFPSIYSADLKIGFHNQLKLSGYLTSTTNKAKFHSINSNDDFQIENVDFLSQFFNRQNKTLRKYDYSWKARLVDIESGGLNYADGDEDYTRYNIHEIAEQCQTSHDAQRDNRKEHYSIIKSRDFGRRLMGSGSSYSMDFNDFSNKAMKGTLRLEDHDGNVSNEACLIEDYYVSLAPVNSKFITLMDLVKEYGFFAQERNPLVTYTANKSGPHIVPGTSRFITCDENGCNRPMKITVPDYQDRTIAKDEGNRIYSGFPSYNADSPAPFLGFTKSIVGDKSNLLVTIPPLFRQDPRFRSTTLSSDVLFDYLRFIIYRSRNNYSNTSSLTANGGRSVKNFGYVSRYAYSYYSSQTIQNLDKKDDLEEYSRRSAAGYDQAVPDSSVFAHLYDLTVSFYPKTIRTQTNIDTTKYKSIKIVTEKLKETDILPTTINNNKSYSWKKTTRADGVISGLSNLFHMYRTEGKKLYYTTYEFFENFFYRLPHRAQKYSYLAMFHAKTKLSRNSSQKIRTMSREEKERINFKPLESNENFDIKQEISLSDVTTGSDAPISDGIDTGSAESTDTVIENNVRTPSVSNISSAFDVSTSNISFKWNHGVTRIQNYVNVFGQSGRTELKRYRYSIEKKSGTNQQWVTVKEQNQPAIFSNEITYRNATDVQEWFRAGHAQDSESSNLEYRFNITAVYEDDLSGTIESDTKSYILDYDPYLFSNLPSLTPYKPNLIFKRSSPSSLTFEVTFDYNSSDNYDSLRRNINQIQVEYYEKSNGVIRSLDKKTLLVNRIRNELSSSAGASSFKQSITIDSLSQNQDYVIYVKTKNIYGESDLSNQVFAKTKVATEKSKIRLSTTGSDVKKLIITEVNVSADSASLTDVDIKYIQNSVIYPINTGPLAVASLSPLDGLDGRAELILVGPPGVYKILATPVYGSLGNGTRVEISVSLPSNSPVNIVNNNTTKQLSSTLLAPYLYIKNLGNTGYYSGNNQATSTTASALEVTDSEDQTVDRVQDISMLFESKNISYQMDTARFRNSTDTTAFTSLQPSFKFVIQKNGNNTPNLICLLGPDPTLMFNAYDVTQDGSFQTLGMTNSGGVLTKSVTETTKNLSLAKFYSKAGKSSNDIIGRQKEYALFYYKLPYSVSKFTNYYYYDKSTDTLYLQLASKGRERYISIQYLINISVENIIARSKPIKIAPRIIDPTTGAVAPQNIDTYFYTSLGLSYHMDLIAKSINSTIKINGTATIPANLLNDGLTGSPSAYRYSSNDQPDNGFYARTKQNKGSNFYNAKLSNNILPNNMSGLRQTWEDVTNLPRDIIYEDSGFYLVSNQTYRAPSNSVDLATISPIILSSSIDNGVGAYKGFSTVTIKAKYEGEIDLNLFSFDGYIVEKYIDNNWVEIAIDSASTEFFEDNSFEGSFSFRIVLADGVTQYRAAIRVTNGQGSVIKGKYVIIDRLFENLIAEDFN